MRPQLLRRLISLLAAGVGAASCAAGALAVPAPRDVVMYEVNLRAFSEAGDLAGVTERLDEIQALGANAIWIMPIHPIGQVNRVAPLGSPYSVRDYGLVSGEYGDRQDLVALVDAAHVRGLSVLMDWVANHTAWDHPWIAAHPDWYTQNGQGQIISPPGTNWADVADLNYSSASMRSAMIGEMTWWVENVAIDGFRADAADFVPRDFWAQAIPAVRAAADRPLLMLAEGARADHYAAGFDMTWGFGFYDTLKSVFDSGSSAQLLRSRRIAEDANVPAGKSILRYTTNHDQSAFEATPPELFGSLEASLAAYGAVVAYGGTPLVYNGQEIGWSENVPIFSKEPLDWDTGAETLAWYSRLLATRQAHPALQEGTFDDRSTADVTMLAREAGADQVLALVNTRSQTRSVTIPVAWRGLWFDQLTDESHQLAESFSLDPYEVLLLAPRPLELGDFDFDGDVDGADLLLWQRGLSPVPMSQADLAAWRANYGAGAGAVVSAMIVPEPATSMLVGAGVLAVGIRIRRRVW